MWQRPLISLLVVWSSVHPVWANEVVSSDAVAQPNPVAANQGKAADSAWLWGLLYPGLGHFRQGNARRGRYFAGQGTALLILTGVFGRWAWSENQPSPPNTPPSLGANIGGTVFPFVLGFTLAEWLWSVGDAALQPASGDATFVGTAGGEGWCPGDLLLSGRIGLSLPMVADLGGEAAWRLFDCHDVVARGDVGIIGNNLGLGWRWFPWGRRPMETYVSVMPLVQLARHSTSVSPAIGLEVGQELWYGPGLIAAQGFGIDIGMVPAFRFMWRFGGAVGGPAQQPKGLTKR